MKCLKCNNYFNVSYPQAKNNLPVNFCPFCGITTKLSRDEPNVYIQRSVRDQCASNNQI